MREEKDMIEINLNAPGSMPPSGGKETNYFGNIRFAKSNNNGFPYGHYENEEDTEIESTKVEKGGCSKYAPFCGTELVTDDSKAARLSCLRQMYCPDCHQRLDEESVRFEKMLACCLPIFPIKCVYQCCVRRQMSRKVICNKCGSNLGYWKRS